MSVFPRVRVESIKIEAPPFDKPGEIQSRVGEALTRTFEMLPSGDDFTPDRVEDFIESSRDVIGLRGEKFALDYTLLITGVSQTGAITTARAFTRVKNPFEADVISVESVSKDEELSGGRLGNVYRVTVRVEK